MASKTLASLIVRIGADTTGVTAGLNTLDKRVRSTKKQFASVTDSTLSWQAALKGLAGAAGLAYAAKKAFDFGSAVEETASKYRTTFGPAVNDVNAFLQDNARLMGLTTQTGRELTATIGAVAQGMGASKEQSAAFSVEAAKLAGDLASFHNTAGGAAQVLKDMQSATVGEFEPMKKYGIVLRQAEINQRALADSGKTSADQLTQLEKATAAMALMQERAGVAVGDLARTMDSPANRARRLTAEFLDLRDSIAHGLLPAFGVILEELDGSVGGFDGLKAAIQNNGAVIAAWTKFAIEAFKTVAKAIAAPIRIAFNLGQQLGEVGNALAALARRDFGALRDSAHRMSQNWGDMKDAITDVIDGFDSMREASGAAWEAFGTGIQKTDALTTSLDQNAAAARRAADALKRVGAVSPPTLGYRAPPAAGITLFHPTAQARGGVGGAYDNLATGLASVFEKVKNDAKRIFDAREIFSNLAANLMTSGLSAVTSAFAGAISGWFGRNDYAEQRQRELAAVTQKNTVALLQLDQGIARLSQSLLSTPGGTYSGIVKGMGLYTSDTSIGFAQAMKRFGVTMSELDDVAESFGITIKGSEGYIREGMDALVQAIESEWMKQLTSTFSGGWDLLQKQFQLEDINDPMEQFKREIEFVSGLVGDDLSKTLRGFASDTTGFDEFIADFIARLKAGDHSLLDELGNLSIEDFLAFLSSAEGALDGLGTAADEATSAVNGMTSALRNIPSGFKVALARFNASAGIAPTTSTDSKYTYVPNGFVNTTTNGSPAIVVNGDLHVRANDPTELVRKVEEGALWAARRGGGAVIQTTNRRTY